MNGVAARALASVILPSYHRPAATGNTTAHSPPPGGGHGHGGSAGKGRGGVQVPGGGVGGGHESSMASGVNDVSARCAGDT